MSMSIPGIGFNSAVTILAEIGGFNDFSNAEQLAPWNDLVPSIINPLKALNWKHNQTWHKAHQVDTGSRLLKRLPEQIRPNYEILPSGSG